MIDDFWIDLQQQLDARGPKNHWGVIQEVTLVTTDPVIHLLTRHAATRHEPGEAGTAPG